MWDEKTINPKNETGYAFTPDMNDEIVKKLTNQSFAKSIV